MDVYVFMFEYVNVEYVAVEIYVCAESHAYAHTYAVMCVEVLVESLLSDRQMGLYLCIRFMVDCEPLLHCLLTNVTDSTMADGIKKLRALQTKTGNINEKKDFWRGVCHLVPFFT
jgi:hypothetical protein